ncbi:hypothetical protein V1477_008922 [Vespula maculifrons]|uniref:Uncharacterized protein n=1 Tax=Vespula maculifrons TaxID=7453 RepID=A0ABD2CGQ7_VESMC
MMRKNHFLDNTKTVAFLNDPFLKGFNMIAQCFYFLINNFALNVVLISWCYICLCEQQSSFLKSLDVSMNMKIFYNNSLIDNISKYKLQ